MHYSGEHWSWEYHTWYQHMYIDLRDHAKVSKIWFYYFPDQLANLDNNSVIVQGKGLI
jgi:hypothetical protein